MSTITITDVVNDGLGRETWVFDFYHDKWGELDKLEIHLSSWKQEDRPTKRHGFKEKVSWKRRESKVSPVGLIPEHVKSCLYAILSGKINEAIKGLDNL